MVLVVMKPPTASWHGKDWEGPNAWDDLALKQPILGRTNVVT